MGSSQPVHAADECIHQEATTRGGDVAFCQILNDTCLARSANLPEGLYILPSVISIFFLFFFYTKSVKYSGESVEKSFVVVVGDAAAILDLTEHVADSVP